MRPLFYVILIAVSLGAAGADCGGSADCECPSCNAVSLSVVDRNNIPIRIWDVTAEHKGAAVDTAGCSPVFRNANTCVFGTSPGIYTVVVSSPGRPSVEAVARQVTTFDCCSGLCNTPESLVVVLDDETELTDTEPTNP
jgi:hypothetical protein